MTQWGGGPQPAEARIDKVTVSGPGKVKKGKKTTYRIKISNSGDAAATEVRLKVSGRGVSFSQLVGAVSAGSTRTVRVKLKAKKAGKIKARSPGLSGYGRARLSSSRISASNPRMISSGSGIRPASTISPTVIWPA